MKKAKNSRYTTKKGTITDFVPKQSYKRGFEDEGISSVLGKPLSFKYSEIFLRNWYKDPDAKED